MRLANRMSGMMVTLWSWMVPRLISLAASGYTILNQFSGKIICCFWNRTQDLHVQEATVLTTRIPPQPHLIKMIFFEPRQDQIWAA